MTNFDKTRIFIFDFKIYPFLKSDDKVKIIKKIGKTQIFVFDSIGDENTKYRTKIQTRNKYSEYIIK